MYMCDNFAVNCNTVSLYYHIQNSSFNSTFLTYLWLTEIQKMLLTLEKLLPHVLVDQKQALPSICSLQH